MRRKTCPNCNSRRWRQNDVEGQCPRCGYLWSIVRKPYFKTMQDIHLNV